MPYGSPWVYALRLPLTDDQTLAQGHLGVIAIAPQNRLFRATCEGQYTARNGPIPHPCWPIGELIGDAWKKDIDLGVAKRRKNEWDLNLVRCIVAATDQPGAGCVYKKGGGGILDETHPLLLLELLLELDVLLPLELKLLLTAVVSVDCAGVTLRKRREHTLFLLLLLLMLRTFKVLPFRPIRGTNKSPTTTKGFLYGACIKTKRKRATHTT